MGLNIIHNQMYIKINSYLKEERIYKKILDSWNLKLISEYKNNNENIIVKCNNCYNEFEDTWMNLLSRKYKCPICKPNI